jgi:hypothetical protein
MNDKHNTRIWEFFEILRMMFFTTQKKLLRFFSGSFDSDSRCQKVPATNLQLFADRRLDYTRSLERGACFFKTGYLRYDMFEA